MKKILLSGIAAVAFLGGPVLAADMPVKAPPMVSPVTAWGGYYFGGQVGGAWNQPDPWLFDNGTTTSAFSGGSSFIIGLHTNSMWQFGHLVLGWDTDYRYTDLKANSSCNGGLSTCQQLTKNIFTTGGRVGFAWNDWLMYGTGGYARIDLETSTIPNSGVGFVDHTSQLHSGWYGGGGVEWAWTNDIHFGVQYTHIHANARNDLSLLGDHNNRRADDNIDIVEARVSFKLWGQGGPFAGK